MNIQYLVTKIEEMGISLWDAPGYTISIKDGDSKMYKVTNVKVDKDKQVVNIQVKQDESKTSV